MPAAARFHVARLAAGAKSPDVDDDPAQGKKTYRFKPKEIERLNAPSAQVAGSARDTPAPLTTDVMALMKENAVMETSISAMPAQSSRWKRSLRLRHYCLVVVLIDTPMAVAAYCVGHTDPVLFVFAISGIALFTSWYTWKVWVLKV